MESTSTFLGYGTYVSFAVFCVLSFVWTFFFVQETNGRTFKQMYHIFGSSTSEAEEAKLGVKAIEGDIVQDRGFTRLAVGINALCLHVQCRPLLRRSIG
jgi:hypothetical protein